MSHRYGSSFFVHLLSLGTVIFFIVMAYQCSVEHFVHGNLASRIGMVTGCVFMAILILWLYVRSGLPQYEISDAGLVIVRPWSREMVPWQQIRHVDWKFAIHMIVIRGSDSVIAFTSTDHFPRLLDFLHEVREKSRCTLSPRLEALLDEDAKATRPTADQP
ncbi:hypothetical protein [Luteolibacter soli]|uniref:PH domain-containing protein n=1 Tax=Luteolibacter soli TaxID=3135280 RepID=A0ABU9B376_9BACT